MSTSTPLFGEAVTEAEKGPIPTVEKYSFSDEHVKQLEAAFRRPPRRPLFVIGSGVSLGCGVPSMKKVFVYLQNELSQKTRYANDKPQQRRIIQATERLSESLAKGPGYRPMAAKLFGELQDSKVRFLADVWDNFCLAFLSGRVDSQEPVGSKRPLDLHEPSIAHRSIARLYETANAACLSFNFDGLTRIALQKQFAGTSDKVFILDGWAKIRDFYGRNPDGSRCYPIFKVRGDIFYAVCKTSGCPAQEKPTPVYEFLIDGATHKDPDKRAKTLIACPECKTQRSLRISFPGLEQKEQETDEIVRELWRYVVPTLSSIFILGLSGVWDEPIIRDLLRAGQLLDLPVFDVKPPAKFDDLDTGYISRIQQECFPDVKYQRITSTADEFMPALEDFAADFLRSRPLTPHLQPRSPSHLEEDGLWVRAPRTHFEVHIPDRSDIVRVPDSSRALAYRLASDEGVKELRRFSQLGLKNYWWGDKSFGHHNRYLHSIGTMQVAAAWHKSLFDSIRKQYRRTWEASQLAREADLLMTAALLHDVGHLPFSHLFEEIFAELHWSTDPFRRVYDHVQYGVERVRRLLEQGAADGKKYLDYLQSAGYDFEDVIALINGHSGIPYLDAIVNSPIDADKIDYIFRDSSELSIGVRLMPRQAWLGEFLADQDLSPEGFVRLNGRSALRLLDLLDTRRVLYKDFYVSPWIRAMEAIAKTIITKFLLLYTSTALFVKLPQVTGTLLDPDWGGWKIQLATEKLQEEYARVEEAERGTAGANERLEQPLLWSLLAQLRDGEVGQALDGEYKTEYLGQLGSILQQFDNQSEEDESGTKLRKVYQELHLAGPFRVKLEEEGKLREVVREVELLFPDKVLFALSKTPRFLSTAGARVYKFRGGATIGENVLVPGDRPASWTMKSQARVPLHTCDFSSFARPYVEVTVLDPWQGAQISGRYVLDLFKRKCKESCVVLGEV